MIKLSRRQLAHYATDQLLARKSPAYIAVRLAAALAQNARPKEADLLMDDIYAELENRGELAKVTLTSATTLSVELHKSLAAVIAKAAKVKNVVFNQQIDQSVIGGFRAETAVHNWDKTVATELAKLKEAL